MEEKSTYKFEKLKMRQFENDLCNRMPGRGFKKRDLVF